LLAYGGLSVKYLKSNHQLISTLTVFIQSFAS